MNWDIFAPKKKDGEHLSHYGKGHLREKRTYLKGKLNGPYESYYESSQPLVKMSFKDGLRHGEAVSYYRDGRIREKCTYDRDRLVGEYTSYYETGQLREKEFYNPDGKLEGEYLLYYRNGQIKEQEHFLDGKFEGDYVSYYKNGQIREKGSFRNDRREGPYEAFDRDGQPLEKATFKAGKLVGSLTLLGAAAGSAAAVYDGQGDEDLDEHEFDRMLRKMADYDKKVDSGAGKRKFDDEEDDEESD